MQLEELDCTPVKLKGEEDAVIGQVLALVVPKISIVWLTATATNAANNKGNARWRVMTYDSTLSEDQRASGATKRVFDRGGATNGTTFPFVSASVPDSSKSISLFDSFSQFSTAFAPPEQSSLSHTTLYHGFYRSCQQVPGRHYQGRPRCTQESFCIETAQGWWTCSWQQAPKRITFGQSMLPMYFLHLNPDKRLALNPDRRLE